MVAVARQREMGAWAALPTKQIGKLWTVETTGQWLPLGPMSWPGPSLSGSQCDPLSCLSYLMLPVSPISPPLPSEPCHECLASPMFLRHVSPTDYWTPQNHGTSRVVKDPLPCRPGLCGCGPHGHLGRPAGPCGVFSTGLEGWKPREVLRSGGFWQPPPVTPLPNAACWPEVL